MENTEQQIEPSDFNANIAFNEEVEAAKYTQEDYLYRQMIRRKNQIAVALAYLEADQPHLAKLVLEGMEP